MPSSIAPMKRPLGNTIPRGGNRDLNLGLVRTLVLKAPQMSKINTMILLNRPMSGKNLLRVTILDPN